jgi:hypothetical protein
MENLNKKQAETLQRALKFYAHHFEGFQIHWFKMNFTEDRLIFYCSDSFNTLFKLLIHFDEYTPIFVIGIEPNGKEIYFGNNRLELGQYLNK